MTRAFVLNEPLLGVILTSAAALVIVGLELTASRMWDRKHRMIDLLTDLNAALGHYLVHLSSIPGAPAPQGSEFLALQSRVLTTLDAARILARFPLRNARNVRVAVQRLAARVAAAWLNYNKGIRLSRQEVVEGFSLIPLRAALLGDDGTLTTETKFYQANGFLSGDPAPTTRRERRKHSRR